MDHGDEGGYQDQRIGQVAEDMEKAAKLKSRGNRNLRDHEKSTVQVQRFHET
jgi:hypothetical protein